MIMIHENIYFLGLKIEDLIEIISGFLISIV